MKGFIKNEGTNSVFILQHNLFPGAKLSFDEAYTVIGATSGKKKGITFIRWLQKNHFSDSCWIFYKTENNVYFDKKENKIQTTERISPAGGAGKIMRRTQDTVEKGSVISADLIINASFPNAQTLIEKCSDKKILKKALALSQYSSKKGEHMRHLMKRLQQVY